MAGEGIELARRYFGEVVRPLLAHRRPGLSSAAGRLGSGSDVLGLDDDRSRDHDWGLRLTVLVADDGTAVHDHQGRVGLPTVADPIVAFWGRPYRAVDGALVAAITETITDPAVGALPVGIGSIEQWVDNTDVLAHPARRVAAWADLRAGLDRNGPAGSVA